MFPLRRVEIRNFRSLRAMDLDLHPRVTVLFGANAAGKTSVLDALAIVLGGVVKRIPNAEGRDFAKTGDLRMPWQTQAEAGERARVAAPFVRIRAHAEGLAWDVTQLRGPQDRARLPEPGLGLRALNEWLDPRVVDALEASPGAPTPSIPLVAAYGDERAVVQVPLRERDFRGSLGRFDALHQSLKATTRFKAVFEWFRVVEDEERRAQIARRDFNFRAPALQWIRQAVARAELNCQNPRVETQPIRMLVDFVHVDGGELEPLDIRALSDGYRTHFALVVDIARRMVQLNPSDDLNDPDRGTNSPGVVLIDEIDLHLDPAWQGRVLRGLLAAFPHIQLVVTTRSEQVIASVGADSVRRLHWQQGAVVVEGVPFAQGASGERILVDLMGAPERVDGAVKAQLVRYRNLVTHGDGQSAEARAPRTELDALLRLNCERLRLARRQVRDQLTAEWLVPLLQVLTEPSHLTEAAQNEESALLVAERLAPDSNGHLRAFWTTEREVVEPISPGWVEHNRSVLGWQ